MNPNIHSTFTRKKKNAHKRKLKHKSNSKSVRFYYDSNTLSDLSPNTRTKFMRLKNKANHRQRRKDNDNRDNLFSKKEAFRDLITSKKTRKRSRKSLIKKPSLYTIRESNSPVLYTIDISELSPNTRQLFLKHKQMAKKRISMSGKTRSMSNKTRGGVVNKSRFKRGSKIIQKKV